MTAPKRGRPRRADADATILSAARELLDETGYAAFNVDVIAERTGIAKTTIYRRWPTKGTLVAAAIDTIPRNDADILEDTERLLAKLDGADLDVLRSVIAPRRARLLAAIGPEADQILGALLLKFVVESARP